MAGVVSADDAEVDDWAGSMSVAVVVAVEVAVAVVVSG
jgi:hypothetical protein